MTKNCAPKPPCRGGSQRDAPEAGTVLQVVLKNTPGTNEVPAPRRARYGPALSKNENIKVYGINYKDNKKNAENFLKELGNPYEKIIFDEYGVKSIDWGAYGVPETFLIYNKKIIKRYIGPLNQELKKEIKLLIK